jgi:hypothetical protein
MMVEHVPMAYHAPKGTPPRAVIRSDGQRFASLGEAVWATPGASKAGIVHACRGRIQTSAGFGWRYANDLDEMA